MQYSNCAEPMDYDRCNETYQAELAQSLLSGLEHEEAIDFCISNEWYGVLRCISTR